MARTKFGPLTVTFPTADDGDLGPYVGTLTVWTAETGGTQLTDLLTIAGTPITQLTVGNGAVDATTGRCEFQGPDPYPLDVWVEPTISGVVGARWQVLPQDIATKTGGVASISFDGGPPQTGVVSYTSPVNPIDQAALQTAVRAALVAGTAITITPTTGNKVTIATTATTNQTDSYLTDLTNAHGSLSADNLYDGTSTNNRVFTQAERTKLAGLTAALTDAQFNAKVKAYLDATGYSPVVTVASDQSDPAVVNGATLLRLSTVSASKDASELVEGVSAGAGTTYVLTPPATVASTTAYLHVTTTQSSASVTGGAVAAAPTGVAGGGRTWTLVPNTSATTANSQDNTSVWKGVGATPTTANVTITVGASHDRILARMVGVSNSTGTVVQSTNSGSTASTSPAATLSGPASGNLMLGFVSQNSSAQTLVLASSGYVELLPQVLNTSPSVKSTAAYATTGTGNGTFTWTASSAAQKVVTLLEVN